MEDLNQSLKEGVCIDEEVFFGPITDKEKKIKENFEHNFKKTNDVAEVAQKLVDNDTSMNDSLFKSFSVEDSKYDSFDDSLNEDNGKLPETKHILLRKSFDKLKQKKHTLYDSLEDICSLASNIEKCSITCDVENNSNLNDKQYNVEDSLQNPKIIITNKNLCASEQIHFDDDSLAIVEFESTFDDSLEDLNVEIEDIQDAEIISIDNCKVPTKIEQKHTCAPRNLFETSVDVIYEKRENDLVDREETSGDKNVFYDSLSNSDFKDILKDSLEESGKITDSLSQYVSDEAPNNNQKPKQVNVIPSVKINVAASDKSLNEFQCDKNPNASVQIIRLKDQETETTDQEFSNYIDIKNDSLSNSDSNIVMKDNFKEFEEGGATLNSNANVSIVGEEKLVLFSPENLDSSVQIIYESLQNLNNDEKTSSTNLKCDSSVTHYQASTYEKGAIENVCNNNNISHLLDVNSVENLSNDIQKIVNVD